MRRRRMLAEINVVPYIDVMLVINDRGELFLNLGANEKQALELATIRQRVAAVLRRTPDKPVLVWGDQKVAYGDVVVVMTALQEAGAPQVGLVTESPAGK